MDFNVHAQSETPLKGTLSPLSARKGISGLPFLARTSPTGMILTSGRGWGVLLCPLDIYPKFQRAEFMGDSAMGYNHIAIKGWSRPVAGHEIIV